MNDKTLVLDERQIELKIKRIAYKIAENHHKTKTLYLCSVGDSGLKLSSLIFQQLKTFFKNEVVCVKFEADGNQFLDEDNVPLTLKKKTFILVDDVINHGNTIANCFHHLMFLEPKRVEIAVLVNRKTTQFPFSVYYTGLELKTTIGNHIKVNLTHKPMSAWLYDKI